MEMPRFLFASYKEQLNLAFLDYVYLWQNFYFKWVHDTYTLMQQVWNFAPCQLNYLSIEIAEQITFLHMFYNT